MGQARVVGYAALAEVWELGRPAVAAVVDVKTRRLIQVAYESCGERDQDDEDQDPSHDPGPFAPCPKYRPRSPRNGRRTAPRTSAASRTSCRSVPRSPMLPASIPVDRRAHAQPRRRLLDRPAEPVPIVGEHRGKQGRDRAAWRGDLVRAPSSSKRAETPRLRSAGRRGVSRSFVSDQRAYAVAHRDRAGV
jgi:hypothetical protein